MSRRAGSFRAARSHRGRATATPTASTLRQSTTASAHRFLLAGRRAPTTGSMLSSPCHVIGLLLSPQLRACMVITLERKPLTSRPATATGSRTSIAGPRAPTQVRKDRASGTASAARVRSSSVQTKKARDFHDTVHGLELLLRSSRIDNPVPIPTTQSPDESNDCPHPSPYRGRPAPSGASWSRALVHGIGCVGPDARGGVVAHARLVTGGDDMVGDDSAGRVHGRSGVGSDPLGAAGRSLRAALAALRSAGGRDRSL